MEEIKYTRTNNGDLITTHESTSNILDVLKVGDLVRIEYYAARYNKRVTRLFEVESITDDGYYIELENAHMHLLVCDGKFLDKGIDPIFKSIIPIEKLVSIEQDLTQEKNMSLKMKKNNN